MNFTSTEVLAKQIPKELPQCIVITHCVRVNWSVEDIEKSFKEAETIIAKTPRTKIVESSESYIHAEVTTKWMHFIDDLEVQKVPQKSILQVRSESRVGISDFNVNQSRIRTLANNLGINIREFHN